MRTPRRLLLLLALFAPIAHADVVYSGTLGKQPIHLVLESYSDGVAIGTYAYDRHDTPIALQGKVDARAAVLAEGDVAVMRLEAQDDEWTDLVGTWSPNAGGTAHPIRLRKEAAMDRYGPHSGPPVEVLQGASTDDHYFKVRFAVEPEGDRARAVAVNVYRKRTDELLQTLEVDTAPRGFSGLDVGDFNFDGVADFSLFESSYSGPNTSTLYFLRDPATGRYARSRIEGISLEFDAKRKLVVETNSCCMGTSVTRATYRVVGDGLELVSRKCLRMDEKSEEMIEERCE